MDITPWTIYWITRLDILKDTCIGVIIVSIGMAITALFMYLWIAECGDHLDQGEKNMKKLSAIGLKISIPVLLLAVLIQVFTPTTKEACAILIIPPVARGGEAVLNEFSGEARELIRDWMRSMEPEKKGAKKKEEAGDEQTQTD